jgi:hypothetical protein
MNHPIQCDIIPQTMPALPKSFFFCRIHVVSKPSIRQPYPHLNLLDLLDLSKRGDDLEVFAFRS